MAKRNLAVSHARSSAVAAAAPAAGSPPRGAGAVLLEIPRTLNNEQPANKKGKPACRLLVGHARYFSDVLHLTLLRAHLPCGSMACSTLAACLSASHQFTDQSFGR